VITAVSAQQSVGVVVALIVVVGWGIYLFSNAKRARAEVGSEIELAANRKPYLADEELEGPKLDRALTWGLVSLAIVGVGLPLYWLAEPGRQAGAIDMMRERREGTTYMHGPGSEPVGGGALYAVTAEGGFNCAGCHGGLAGAPVPATLTDPETGDLRQVEWWAPSMDDVTLRMTEDQLRDVLTYGRPFSPMPAWGVEGGGPMNEQQIDNIIMYLQSQSITPEEGRARAAEQAAAEQERLGNLEDRRAELEEQLAEAEEAEETGAEVEADAPTVEQLERAIASIEAEIGYAQPATEGAAIFNTQCARCHTKGWSYDEPSEPGSGAFGPSLLNVLQQFPLEEDHAEFIANSRAYGEQYGEQGQASGRMPYFAQILTEEQIAAVTEYERELAEQAGEEGENGQ
jgi:mono/diheme cytochrome c family protein